MPRTSRPAARARPAPVLALLAAPLAARPAHAQRVFDFTYTGAGISTRGQFTTTATATNGAYTVTGITGTRNGAAITGLIAPGDPTFANDNSLYASGPYADYAGIAFTVGSAGSARRFDIYDFNMPTDNPSYRECTDPCATTPTDPQVTFTVTPATTAPEPATLALLGAGLLGVGGAARQRRRA